MVSSLHDVPGGHVHQTVIRAHAAADATEKVNIFEAPFATKIRAVYIRPDAAITGADTNTTHVNLINAGTAGTGTTELGNINFTDTVDAAIGERLELYAPDAALAVDANTLLVVQLELVGTGLALPQFLCVVEYEGD